MWISDRVKYFVEDNIDKIDEEDSFMLFTCAYEELDNSECAELMHTLREIGYPNLEEARANAMTYLMHRAVEGYEDYPDEHDVISVQRFQAHYLTSRLGYTWDEFIRFLEENDGEWPGITLSERDGIPVFVKVS